MNDELEQVRVQLAGCLTAAEGARQSVYIGDYGWSPAYQAVIELRKLYEKAAQHSAHLTALRRGLAASIFINVVLLAVVAFIIGGR